MKAFIINLDRSINNFNKQKPYLEKIGLDINRFKAIDASKDEHLKYIDSKKKLLLEVIPKSTIAISLSHILLSQFILDKINSGDYKDNYYLIMEDDAYPFDYYNKNNFNQEIKNLIENINIIDKNWDFIQLHSDGINDCVGECKTYNINFFLSGGSAAAYLISINGLKKLSLEKNFYFHLDVYTSINKKYRKYKVKKNIFYTDENLSGNRSNENNLSLLIKKNLLEQTLTLRGEKKWNHVLNYNILKFNNNNISLNTIIDIVLISIICFLVLLSFIIYKNKKHLKFKNFFTK